MLKSPGKNPETKTTRVSRSVSYAMILSVALLIIAVATSAKWTASEHDQRSRDVAAVMMGSTVGSERNSFISLSNDYAFWDPYYEAVLAEDNSWLYPNVGVGVEGGATIEVLAMVLPGHDRHIGWSYLNMQEDPLSNVIDESTLSEINAALDATATTSREGVYSYEEINGETWLFAANRITPREGISADVPDKEIPRQIMGKRLTDALMTEFNDLYLLNGTALSVDAPVFDDFIELKTVGGDTAGYVSWQAPKPGAAVLRNIPMSILLVLAIIIGFMIIAALHVRSNAKELEDTLEREMLANRHKDAFIATVSHELRTPLTSITASIDMLSMGMLGQLPEKALEVLEISDRNAKTLNSLIEDLLLIGSIDSGNLRIQREMTDVNEMVKTSVENFRGYANEQNVTVELTQADQPLEADVDTRKVIQVISNLLSNAAKFSPDGGVIRVLVEQHDGDKIRISVSDDGIGIPDGNTENVFGRFRQVDSGDKRKHNGTGVGLNISREIMNAHGGTLDYKSALGVGSTFFMEFNQDAAAAVNVAKAA